MKKIAFIINGKIKNKQKVVSSITEVFLQSCESTFFETQKGGHASEIAYNACKKGFEYIIGVCGDGTLNEIVNGVMRTDAMVRKKIVLGLLPNGTGNDFARMLGVKNNATQLLNLIQTDSFKPIDIGLVDYTSFDGTPTQRYFNNITEIGVGSQSVKFVNQSSKWMGSNLTFFKSIIKSFVKYKHQNVKITADDFTFEGKIVNVCVANGSYFGSGLGISPYSLTDDGLFNLVIVGNVRMIDFLKYLPKLKKKAHIKHKEVQYLTTRNCTIDIAGSAHYPFDIDGEYVGNTPFSVKLLPREINFLQVITK